MNARRAPPIDLAEDLRFTRRSWGFERAGWLGIGALVLTAILGGVGPGLLSRVTREAGEGRLHVEFERMAHYETEGTILVRVKKPPGPGVLEIRIEDPYAGKVEIEWTQPRPLRTVSEEGTIRYTFETPTAAATWTGVFHVNYPQLGALAGRLGLSTGEAVELSQFVFP